MVFQLKSLIVGGVLLAVSHGQAGNIFGAPHPDIVETPSMSIADFKARYHLSGWGGYYDISKFRRATFLQFVTDVQEVQIERKGLSVAFKECQAAVRDLKILGGLIRDGKISWLYIKSPAGQTSHCWMRELLPAVPNSSLAALYLEHISLTSAQVLGLAQGFGGNTLSLEHVGLDERGIMAIAEGLSHNISLRRVSLREYFVKESGVVDVLAPAIESHPILEVFSLYGAFLAKDPVQRLLKMLEESQSLRELNFSGESTSEAEDALSQWVSAHDETWYLEHFGSYSLRRRGAQRT